jgi:hypothetical protein
MVDYEDNADIDRIKSYFEIFFSSVTILLYFCHLFQKCCKIVVTAVAKAEANPLIRAANLRRNYALTELRKPRASSTRRQSI